VPATDEIHNLIIPAVIIPTTAAAAQDCILATTVEIMQLTVYCTDISQHTQQKPPGIPKFNEINS
jgi:hypothetical protein